MKIFRRNNSEKIKRKILDKNVAKNSALFVFGALLSALAFNMFFLPNNFVRGSLGGVAIIINNFISIKPVIIILIGNCILILISLFILGFKKSLLSIIGACTYTLFVYATAEIPKLINFSFDNILLYVIAAGVVSGFGESLVYKAGFNTGGIGILARIIQKYKNIPLGQIVRNITIVIIIVGGITFGYTAVMYSLIITIIATYLVDKVLIGISNSKVFFIHTTKEDDVKDFILKIIESGISEFDIKGSYTNKRKKMLMCVVPTEKYTFLKQAIKEIDNDAFIVVSDCYEVLGGTSHKKLSFK